MIRWAKPTESYLAFKMYNLFRLRSLTTKDYALHSPLLLRLSSSDRS